ncbi:MAG TPA: SDR family NAD(P)-dependent oxidoreductase, partial [Vicinamibacterales bacterium]|nr:SDR family NAD(P)-dependent oxidoreductase [Vicinamibacterales bacterium]
MHRDVADATVMLLEESNNRRLVGYTVAREGVRLSWDAIRDHLRDKLPAYMVPAAFVQMDALPVNANGKIDRRALPAPAAERSATEAAYVAPRGDLEERIAKIWRDVLELERIGVDDNFFDLGGHSLLLIRVHAKITEVLGRDVPIVDLFEFPTVASLARHLGGDTARADATAPAAEPVASGVESIAIIGMAGRFPGAGDIDTFWRNLRNGVESVRFFTDEELADAGISPELIADPNYVRARGVLDGIELFDAEFFGYTPREAELMDPQHRLFLECAWEALESAGYDPDRYRGAIGVAAGSNLNTYVGNLIANPELMASVGGVQALIGIAGDFLTTRVSYKLNLRGPSLNVQTACSTSLVAVQVACRALAMNDCDIALAGGVSVTVPQIRGHLFMEGGIASPDGHCRAFDRRSQGTVPANGVGVVVLKRLSRAIADGDTIHAVIRGAAVNNDGAQKVGYTAPGVEGQADVVARAMQEARVAPETVSYIETHGTGTALGDPIEIKALTAVYGTRADKTTAIGSLKSNFGHLDAAAGIGGLLKAVLALKHRELPPSLHFESPNPNLDLDRTPFYVNDRLRPWVSDTPRRAGVSSFGIGGTNAHVVLEEAPAVDASSASRPVQVLCVSARTPEALVALAARYADYIDAHPGVPLADIAYTINVGRRAFAHRRVVVCSTHDEAARGLRNVSAAPAVNNEVSGGDQSCVFMFTGQGSQTSGMFRGLYESEPAFRDEIDSMCRAIAPHVGCDLRDVLFGAVTETAAIDQTQFAQPVLFIVEYALARLVQRWGVTPGALIGHSLGEYVAACLAGVMSLDDALRVVAARGRLMQAMAPGAMLAVSLAEAELRDVLSADVSIAALNAPALSVVSGPLDAIAGVEARLTARGVGCQRLKTSHAFHSAMMEPALDAFRRVLQSVSLNAPQIPFVSNLSGTWITGEQATSPEYWVEHLRAPVRFGDGVATLVKQGHAVLLEIGNGEVLTTLARMQPGVTARRIIALRPRGSDSDLAATLSAIGRLWTARVRVDWPALYAGERRLRVALPTYPFQKQRYWIDRRVDAGSRRAARITKRDNGAEWFYEPHWSPAASTPAATEGRWLVFADQNDTSSAITRALEQRGAQLTIVRQGPSFAVAGREYRVDASVRDQFDALMSELGRRGEWPRHVVHLWNAAAVAPSAATAPGFQPPAFFSALHLVQALAASGSTSPIDLHVVCSQSAMVLDTDVVAPEQRTLAGLLAVVPQEYPYMRCARHDLDAGSGTNGSVGAVVDALLGGAVAPVVAYRNGQRLIEHYRPCTPPALKGQPSGRVYLITGGLGGVALAVARRVAAGGNARLALVARTPLPSRGTWDAVLVDPNADDRIKRRIVAMRDLEAAGAQVLVLTADVTDAAAMDAAFSATVARFGGVDVVIHTAGVTRGPGFEPIASLSTTACAQQFAPKVQGAYVLEALVERYRPSACVLTSSLSAVLGGLGMAGYAAANAFLDGFAEARDRRRGTRWVSLNLDGWAFDVERTSDTVLAMTRAEGADAVLRAAMHHDGPPRVVI